MLPSHKNVKHEMIPSAVYKKLQEMVRHERMSRVFSYFFVTAKILPDGYEEYKTQIMNIISLFFQSVSTNTKFNQVLLELKIALDKLKIDQDRILSSKLHEPASAEQEATLEGLRSLIKIITDDH